MRQKKAAAEAAKQKAAAAEEAKRQRSMMPPPPPMAPKQPKTLPSKKVTLPAAPAPPAPPAKPPAGLPPGFFDSAATSSEAPKSLVAYGSDDSDSDDAEEAPAAAAAPSPAPAKAGELPAGFFDDKNADLKARGVDPEKAKAESEAKAWAEFSEFAGGVARDEAQDAESEAQENDDESRRRALDQAWYERRLAPLMARADGAKAPVVNDAVARVGDADDGGVDIAAALAAREQKDKEKAAAAAAMLPIDDDLSDDDLNEALWNQPRYTVPGFQKGQ